MFSFPYSFPGIESEHQQPHRRWQRRRRSRRRSRRRRGRRPASSGASTRTRRSATNNRQKLDHEISGQHLSAEFRVSFSGTCASTVLFWQSGTARSQGIGTSLILPGTRMKTRTAVACPTSSLMAILIRRHSRQCSLKVRTQSERAWSEISKVTWLSSRRQRKLCSCTWAITLRLAASTTSVEKRLGSSDVRSQPCYRKFRPPVARSNSSICMYIHIYIYIYNYIYIYSYKCTCTSTSV